MKNTHYLHDSRFFKYAVFATCATLVSSQASFAADGALTGAPAILPTITSVETDSQVGTVGAANCAQQLDNFIFGLDVVALGLEGAAIGAASGAVLSNQVAIVADIVGLVTESLGGDAIGIAAQIVAVGASQVAVGLEATQLGLAAAALADQSVSVAANQVASGLSNCNSTFTGSVVVEAGGIDVTGNSKVDGEFGITGDFSATKGEFGQGVSAYAGQLSLGDSSLNSFFAGITIGGGEFAGAGTGGADAFTGDVNAIAIGNGSSAANAGSIALGLAANSSAIDAVAIGSNSSAAGASSVALGNNASATMTNAVAVGASSSATGVGSLALGNNSTSSALNAIAIGTASVASAENASALGQGATAAFESSTAIGTGATTLVNNQIVLGTTAQNITAPGITSSLSASRQTGKLSLVTTDDGGNLAFDGGAVFKEIANNRQGIAIALAAQTPNLVAGETGAIVFNLGNFKDATAVSMGAAAVLGQNLFSENDRFTVSGTYGVNITRSRFMTRESDPYNSGGRIGMQYSWR